MGADVGGQHRTGHRRSDPSVRPARAAAHPGPRSRSQRGRPHRGDGFASLWGTLFVHDATALDRRLDALATTTCDADPRTRDQRRADALGALACGADRLACQCGSEHCPAASAPVPSGVVVHVVAHSDAVAGPGAGSAAAAQHAGLDGKPRKTRWSLGQLTLVDASRDGDPNERAVTRPGATMGGAFLPGPLTRRAALNATVKAIVHPGDSPPELRTSHPRRCPTSFGAVI